DMNKISLIKLVGLLTFLVFISSCGGDKTVQPNFPSLNTNFFSGCGNATCHRSGTDVYSFVQFDLNVDQATAYTVLTSGTIKNLKNPACSNIPMVKAGDYANSLVAAMAGSDADRATFAAAHGGCSPTRFSDMPQAVSSDVQSALQTWINAGAQSQ
ncbi:MAG: hypothetical protein JWQ35_1066, partial [Bacteriovoracaceae bacterium]|nr:hypothetical protein [Bacteriovoracaceae bacterium]